MITTASVQQIQLRNPQRKPGEQALTVVFLQGEAFTVSFTCAAEEAPRVGEEFEVTLTKKSLLGRVVATAGE